MTASSAKVIDKIQKLKAHMESASKIGNEAEAQAFAAMMQRMMLQHNIEMTDLDVARMEAEEPVEEHWFNPDGKTARVKMARSYWIEDLATIVARAHFCELMLNPRTNMLMLVGRKSNIEVAEFMIVTLSRLIHKMALREWWKEWRKRGGDENYSRNREVREDLKGFRPAYVKAFTQRLRERYEEERQRATAGPTATSTALVRVNRAEAAVKAHMQAKYADAKPAKAITKFQHTSHSAGWHAGRKAADGIDLGTHSHAVKTTEQQRLDAQQCNCGHAREHHHDYGGALVCATPDCGCRKFTVKQLGGAR